MVSATVAEAPIEAAAAIAAYTPRLPVREWALIAGFVQSVTGTVLPRLGATDPAKLIYHVAYHVRWACLVAGYPQDPMVVFHAEVIDAGVVRIDTDRVSAMGKRRALLRRVGEALGAIEPARTVPLSGSRAWQPCTPEEIQAFRVWAKGKHHPRRGRSARVLLALGLGAGLAAGEIMTARAADVQRRGDGRLEIAAARRMVVIEEAWAAWLDPFLADPAWPADGWLFEPGIQRDPNLLARFVHREGGTRIGVMAQRLRATWLVARMQDSTVVELLSWSGLASLQGLARYARFLPPAVVGDGATDAADSR